MTAFIWVVIILQTIGVLANATNLSRGRTADRETPGMQVTQLIFSCCMVFWGVVLLWRAG